MRFYILILGLGLIAGLLSLLEWERTLQVYNPPEQVALAGKSGTTLKHSFWSGFV